MLTESDIVNLLKETKKSIEDGIKKDAVNLYPMREVTSLFALIGRLKRDPKYIMYAEVFGSIASGLMRLPPDFSHFLTPDKESVKKVLQKLPVALDDFAQALESNPRETYGSLEKLALVADEIRTESDKISRRLPKEIPIE